VSEDIIALSANLIDFVLFQRFHNLKRSHPDFKIKRSHFKSQVGNGHLQNLGRAKIGLENGWQFANDIEFERPVENGDLQLDDILDELLGDNPVLMMAHEGLQKVMVTGLL
jgi:hypothetical protein